MTAIANSHADVDDLCRRTLSVLDRETGYGRPAAPYEATGL